MRVRLHGAGDAGWGDWPVAVRHDVYHLGGYHAWSRDRGEGEPYLIVVENGERGFAWPYLLRPVAGIPGLEGCDAMDVTSVYGYPGPLAWGCRPGDPFICEAWAEVQATWRAQHVVAAFTRFSPLLGNAALMADARAPVGGPEAPTPVVVVGPTVSLDCTSDDETTTAGFARAIRQHLAAGRRAGLVTEHDTGWSRLPGFTSLYRRTMERNGAAPYYMFDLADFERLRVALPGHLHLLVTSLGDEIGAAGLFTELGGIVQAHLVGTNSAMRQLSPCATLFDDARRWARERGDTVLHLGGGRGGREDSLFSFKGRFSPIRHQFSVGRWVLDGARYRELVRASRDGLRVGADSPPTFFPAYRAPVMEATEPAVLQPGE